MRIIIFFLSIITVCCKGPDGKVEKLEGVVQNILTDTLFSDNYNWQYFVTPKEDIYFLKQENTLYVNKKKIGKISLIFEAERFIVSRDYIAIEYIDSNALNVINIYNQKDLTLTNKIINSHIIDVFFEDNRIITNKENKDNLEVYDITSDSVMYLFSEGENYPIITSKTIYNYDAMSLKNNDNQLIINTYDRSTFNRMQDLTISNPKERLVLSIFNEKYIAEQDEKLYLVDFLGKDIEELILPTESSYQMVVNSNAFVSFYYWMEASDGENGDYYLLRQKISLP
jgi:hypothetical protein